MIIRGRFIWDAPHFAVHIRSARFQGLVCTNWNRSTREVIEMGWLLLTAHVVRNPEPALRG